jgi:hypothetical protein
LAGKDAFVAIQRRAYADACIRNIVEADIVAVCAAVDWLILLTSKNGNCCW